MIRTTFKQKIFLILLSIFLILIILECGLRITGAVLLLLQERGNRITQDTNSYRILCLGESTTANLYNSESSWPEQLEIILNEKSREKKFEVINKGVGGKNTGFILSEFEKNLEKYKPNMVITMMGINDPHVEAKYTYNDIKIDDSSLLENFRVYKLINLIYLNWKYRIRLFGRNTSSITSRAVSYYGWKDQSQYSFGEAEKMFKKAIEIDKDNEYAYIGLGYNYRIKNNFEEAEKMFKEAMKLNPYNEYSYSQLGGIYQEEGRFGEAEKMFKKAKELRMAYYNPLTKNNYRELYDISNQKSIKLIIMQYPMRSIDELKSVFQADEDITFVDNEENFKEAFKNESSST